MIPVLPPMATDGSMPTIPWLWKCALLPEALKQMCSLALLSWTQHVASAQSHTPSKTLTPAKPRNLPTSWQA